MESLKDSVDITLKGKKYNVKFPNIGEYIKIESNKQRYADGNYAMLAWSNIASMNIALDIIDSVSYFSVLIGAEFLKAYKIQSTEKVFEQFNHTSKECKELLEAYRIYSEFYNSIDIRDDRPNLEKENVGDKTKESDGDSKMS